MRGFCTPSLQDIPLSIIQACINFSDEVYAASLWAQVLIIQIWAEEDLSALHTLEVTEDDFQGLKQEQGILVDFGGFPAKIITLLQRCLASYHEDPPRSAIMLCTILHMSHVCAQAI